MAASNSALSQEETDDKFSLYAELKPHLSIVQLTIKIPKNCAKRDVVLKVSKSCIQLVKKIPSRQFNHTLDVQGLTFVPPSCHGMKSIGDELHFRMQAMATVEDQPRLSISESHAAELRMFDNPNFHCFCRMCGQVIVQNAKFRRVLPLPSDNWHEMADSLFCHKHGDSKGVDGTTSLAPREGDCLVAKTHFLLHESSVIIGNLLSSKKSGHLVQCSRCRQTLGRDLVVDQVEENKGRTDGVCLFVHCVHIPVPLQALPQHHVTESFGQQMARMLLAHSQEYNSFRFVVVSRDAGGSQTQVKPSMLLWVLDSQTLVCQCTKPLDENSIEKLDTVPVIKLLYTDCLREQKQMLCNDWRKDLTVHHLELPYNVCYRLLGELMHSTQLLPNSLRIMNNFYVGSLPR